MIVAVQKELAQLARDLETEGIETVVYGEYNYPIDALVYVGASAGEPRSGNFSSGKAAKGILCVNAQNKTARQVMEVLNKRLYEPIF